MPTSNQYQDSNSENQTCLFHVTVHETVARNSVWNNGFAALAQILIPGYAKWQISTLASLYNSEKVY